jgi:hypothetical protein
LHLAYARLASAFFGEREPQMMAGNCRRKFGAAAPPEVYLFSNGAQPREIRFEPFLFAESALEKRKKAAQRIPLARRFPSLPLNSRR